MPRQLTIKYVQHMNAELSAQNEKLDSLVKALNARKEFLIRGRMHIRHNKRALRKWRRGIQIESIRLRNLQEQLAHREVILDMRRMKIR